MRNKKQGGCPHVVLEDVVAGRRKLLQAAWVTPVVSSVCLPAHAATSTPDAPVRNIPTPPDPSVVINGDPVTPQTFPNDPVSFTVINTGNVPVTSGVITINVPVTFISLIFPATIPTLPPGGTETVVITFNGTEPCTSYPGSLTVAVDFAEARSEIDVSVVCTV